MLLVGRELPKPAVDGSRLFENGMEAGYDTSIPLGADTNQECLSRLFSEGDDVFGQK
jgi:hypothetical protein